ncbi:hypothetical protein A5819_000864 [Enterococcus sp. 7E2_DIV0204]|uniref:Uncharacterized protein n=1 Tax=Candidatus Enterococcus lemimoniae TaxID=1834167 RepID=A0ABZ2TDH0_9ENTE|nr:MULTISPECIES: hypothetical protein [unclassified Enterococcus]OTN88383.1 hypothetical protein A5819_000864 [Enterococcus sp. 7E2_DIV0204]OTO70568.1 hypothetical protein A5866_002805 [Enterococcus sp. 12C11_DIV0727]OTP50854.1 hypothetical protein A5884_000040 [Enterococcus sp. 7D2_DIV0200]
MTNKKSLFKIGLSLTILGFAIAMIGFALSGGQVDKYKFEEHSWYRTFYFEL